MSCSEDFFYKHKRRQRKVEVGLVREMQMQTQTQLLLLCSLFISCAAAVSTGGNPERNVSISRKDDVLPIDTVFDLPSALPQFPAGQGFASGVLDLGGLLVQQVSSFSPIWTIYGGGPDNLGISFFEPLSIPEGYSMLGSYAQPNNRPLFGWVLVAKDMTGNASNSALKSPISYTLSLSQDGSGYIWLPVPPDGYKAVGYLVTNSSEMPPLDRVSCVRSDLTSQTELDEWIWGDAGAITVSSSRPSDRRIQSASVGVGTFIVFNGTGIPSSLACLRNNAVNNFSLMPNEAQIHALIQVYSPIVYFHNEESYFPSSVNWFFTNGALLYTKGQESNPIPVEATGSNLPQGGGNDGAYWLDLPIDAGAKEAVKRGNIQGAQAYLHVKPMLGATFTDIAVWLFYPFNGGARAKVKFFTLKLGRLGEHVGDWEHLTLRISNFDGRLRSVYFSEHSSGIRVVPSQLEFQTGNKFVVYSSLHGHAAYITQGTVLQGNDGVGIRNDCSKSDNFLDTGANYSIIAADHLASAFAEPSWLEYFREWGPLVEYDYADELNKVAKALPGQLKKSFMGMIQNLPSEILSEEGPTGPKMKPNWSGDEA